MDNRFSRLYSGLMTADLELLSGLIPLINPVQVLPKARRLRRAGHAVLQLLLALSLIVTSLPLSALLPALSPVTPKTVEAATITKLSIASISPASPTTGQAFSVTVQAQDSTGTAAAAAQAISVNLSVKTGTGVLGGTTGGTIAVGANSITISGVTYGKAEAGVALRADDDANPNETTETGLTPGDSAAFNVAPPPPGIAASPSSGIPGSSATVSGANFNNSDSVEVFIDDTKLGAATASKGGFSANVTIPFTAQPGSHTISAAGLTASGDLSKDVAIAAFTVTALLVRIDLQPGLAIKSVGDIFTMDLVVDAGSQQVDTAQVFLNFDPARTRVVDANGAETNSITPNATSPLSQTLKNTVDNSLGQIDFTAGQQSPAAGGQPAKDKFVLAAVRFKVTGSSPGAPVSFSLTSPRATGAFLAGKRVGGPGPGATIGISGVSLSITPSSKAVGVNDIFTLDINAATGPQKVDTIQLNLNFDPTKVKVVDAAGVETQAITANAGSLLPQALKNTADNNLGRIDFTAGQQSPAAGGQPAGPNASFPLATIRFKAVNPSPGSIVSFSRSSTRQTDAFFQGGSVLGPFVSITPAQPGANLETDPTPVAAASIGIAGVTLSIDPPSSSVNVGQTLTINIKASTGPNQTDVIDAHVNFDPSVLQVKDADATKTGIQVTAGADTKLPVALINSADNTLGRIDFSAGQQSPGVGGVPAGANSTFTLATITFSTLAATTNSSVTLSRTSLRRTGAFFQGKDVTGPLNAGSVSAGAILSVEVVTPTTKTGPAGSKAVLRGKGFSPNQAVTITWDNPVTTLDTPTADATGSFDNRTVTIPAGSPAGPRTIKATQGTLVVTDTFTVVTPVLSLNPATGEVGTTVTATGSNFAPNETLNFTFDGLSIATTPSPVAADANGALSASFTVPQVTAGDKPVVASQLNGVVKASAIFTIRTAPTFTGITENIAGQGASSRAHVITGAGFKTGATVEFLAATGIIVKSASVLSATSISIVLDIAQAAPVGKRNIKITNSDGGSVTTTSDPFEITAAPTVTAAAPDQLSQGSAQVVTLTGTGFKVGAGVSVSGAGVSVSNIKVVSASSITTTFTVADGATTGPRDIMVTNIDGGKGTGVNLLSVLGKLSDLNFSFSPAAFANANAGATTNVTGRFTAQSPVPVGGKINVQFPAGFSVAGASLAELFVAGVSCTSAAFNVLGQVATITLPATCAVSVSNAVAMRFAGIVNPNTPGDYSITVVTDNGSGKDLDSGAAVLRVVGLTLEPAKGLAGSSVKVTGAKFAAGEAVTLAFNGTTLTTTPANVVPDPDGFFTATVVIPATATGGEHLIIATQGASLTAKTAFAVIVPATFIKVSGDPQTGVVGAQLSAPFVVEAKDANNSPVQGVSVNFSVVSVPLGAVKQDLDQTIAGSQGTVLVSTGADGRAQAFLTLGERPGPYVIQAVAGPNLTVSFSVTAEVGPAASLAKAAGDGQSQPVGATLLTPLVVQVQDSFNNPVPNTNVTFTIVTAPVSAAGQQLTSDTTTGTSIIVTTDTSGRASASLTLGKKIGAYEVEAGSGSLAKVKFTATATVGTPSQIAKVSGDGQSATVGSFLSQPVIAEVRDQGGNPIANVGVTFAITSPAGSTGQQVTSGTKAGTSLTVVTGVNGQAQVNVRLGSKPGNYSIDAASGTLPKATFTATANVGAPAKLAFAVQPGGGSAGDPWSQQPQLVVQDSQGNTVTTANNVITLVVTSGTGTAGAVLTCAQANNQMAAASGVASFTGCKIDKAGTGYTLTATAAGLASAISASFAITPAGAVALAFATQPGGGIAGVAWGQQPVVEVRDNLGNLVSGDNTTQVLLTITTGTGSAGATLICTANPVTVTVGVANFAGCKIDKAGASYTLDATAVGLTKATSNAFSITPGNPAKLAFSVQPGGGRSSTAWTQQPVVVVQDSQGNIVNTANNIVTLSITPGTGPLGATLVCDQASNQLTASAGAGSFTGCKIDKAKVGYSLTVSSTGLASAISALFNITPGPADLIAKDADTTKSGDAQTAPAGTVLPQPLVALVKDQNGNPVPDVKVTFAITASPGATGQSILVTEVFTGTDGQARTGLRFGNRAGSYVVTATCNLCLTATQITFTATATVGAPARLVKVPGGDKQIGTVGQTLASAFVVEVQDQDGNPVSGVNVTFAIVSSPAGALGQDIDQAAAGAQTTFTAVTGADGRSPTTLTLGNKEGDYIVDVTSGSLVKVTFSARAGLGTPAKLVKISGDNQAGEASAPLSAPFVAELRDSFENPLPNVTVSFSIVNTPSGATGQALTSGTSSGITLTVVTGANGRANTTLTLGNLAGIYGVDVASGTLTKVTFTAVAPVRIAQLTPDNPEVSKTTTYRGRLAFARRIAAGGSITLTFPTGFDLGGGVRSTNIPVPTVLEPGAVFEVAVNNVTNTSTCSLVSTAPICANSGGYQIATTTSVGETLTSEAFSIVPQPPSTTIFVRVVDNAGAGLNGVPVVLEGPKTGNKEVTTATSASGASGIAQFTNVFVETVGVRTKNATVTVNAQDFSGITVPVSVTVQVPMPAGSLGSSEANAATLTLRALVVNITIPVDNQTGAAISAQVVASGPPGVYQQTRNNLAAGTTNFTLSLPAGTYTIALRSPEGATISFKPEPATRQVTISGNATTEGFVLRSAALPLAGRVIEVDLLTGADIGPVAGAKVSVSSAALGSFNSTTDGSGGFSVKVPAGTYTVHVSHPNFASFPASQVKMESDGTTTPSSVDIRGNRPPVKIKGVVLRGTTPVKDARVTAREKVATGARTSIGTTDASGAFEIPVPASASSSGTGWGLKATVLGFGTTPETVVAVFNSDVTQNIDLPTTASLNVTVKDVTVKIDGVGAQGAAIAADPKSTEPQPGTVVTDSNGASTILFQIPDPGGERFVYNVRVSVPGIASTLPREIVEVDSAGTFLDKDGEPITSLAFEFKISTITFNYNRAVKETMVTATSTGGDFRAANSRLVKSESPNITKVELKVPRPKDSSPVTYGLVVTVTGFTPSTITMTPSSLAVPGDGSIQVALPSEEFTISGTVSSNPPIEGATVSFVGIGFADDVDTDKDGKYIITAPPGEYQINATATGFAPSATETITVSNNTTKNFTLEQARFTISGAVGTQADEATIVLTSAGRTVTAQMGGVGPNCGVAQVETPKHYCAGVPEGTWTVDVVADSQVSTGAKTVTVPPSATKVNLNMTPAPKKESKSQQITKSGGGTSHNTGSLIIVTVPPGALGTTNEIVTLTIQETSDAPTTATLTPSGGVAVNLTLIDTLRGFITQFNSPITVRLEGFTGDFVGFFDTTTGTWRVIPTCTKDANGFTCLVDHLTKFSVLSKFSVLAGGGARPGPGTGGLPGGPTPLPTPVPVVVPTSRIIDPAVGGELNAGNVRLVLPSGFRTALGAVTISANPVTIRPLGVASAEVQAPVPAGFTFGSATFQVSATDAQSVPISRFDKAISIVVKYTADDLAKAGGDPSRIKLMRYDSTSKQWVDLQATVDASAQTLTGLSDMTGLFALTVKLPTPTVLSPAGRILVPNLAPLLRWQNPAGVTQYHIQIIPANNDGPGIDLLIGDQALVALASYQIKLPQIGVGNYVMLPGLSYTWKVRTSSEPKALGVNDPGWSDFVSGSFQTQLPVSWSISPVSPSVDGAVDTLTPTLTWSNSFNHIFYYEIQLSKDPGFNTAPATAVAAVYWELVHGGESQPLNSYKVRSEFALESDSTYYWRVRPRVQGDGPAEGVAWSETWSFATP